MPTHHTMQPLPLEDTATARADSNRVPPTPTEYKLWNSTPRFQHAATLFQVDVYLENFFHLLCRP